MSTSEESVQEEIIKTSQLNNPNKKSELKFSFDNSDLIYSVELSQKSLSSNPKYSLKINCKTFEIPQTIALSVTKDLGLGFYNPSRGEKNSVIYASLRIEQAIKILKYLNQTLLMLPEETSKQIFMQIYGIMSDPEIKSYTKHFILNKVDIDTCKQLIDLFPAQTYEACYYLARQLKKLYRIEEAIIYYKKVPSSDSLYPEAQAALALLATSDSPEARKEQFSHLIALGSKKINAAHLQEMLQIWDKSELKKIVCNEKNDPYLLLHCAILFNTLNEKDFVDDLCQIIERLIDEGRDDFDVQEYGAFYVLMAGRRVNTEPLNSNHELQRGFYSECSQLYLAGNRGGHELVASQMAIDCSSQPIDKFLFNVLSVSKENKDIGLLYHAAIALAQNNHPVLAFCLLNCVKKKPLQEEYFNLAKIERRNLLPIILTRLSDVQRINTVLDVCNSVAPSELESFIEQSKEHLIDNVQPQNDDIHLLKTEISELKIKTGQLEEELARLKAQNALEETSNSRPSSSDRTTFFK